MRDYTHSCYVPNLVMYGATTLLDNLCDGINLLITLSGSDLKGMYCACAQAYNSIAQRAIVKFFKTRRSRRINRLSEKRKYRRGYRHAD